MEVGLELGAIVRLHDLDAKGQPAAHFVDEPDSRALIAGVIDLEHADPGAVVDGRELIQPRARARDTLEEFHIDLHPMASGGCRRAECLPARGCLEGGDFKSWRGAPVPRVTTRPARGAGHVYSVRSAIIGSIREA